MLFSDWCDKVDENRGPREAYSLYPVWDHVIAAEGELQAPIVAVVVADDVLLQILRQSEGKREGGREGGM